VGFVYPVYDRLSRLPSCHVSVADSNNVRLIARSRLKHDRADARALGELLRTNFLPTSYISDEETREKKFLINDRVRYGLRRGQLRTSIRWLLKRRGIEIEKVFSPEGRRRLGELRLREMDIRLDELELIESIIERLDEQIASTVLMDPNAKLLDTFPGSLLTRLCSSRQRLGISTASKTRSTSVRTWGSYPLCTSQETCS